MLLSGKVMKYKFLYPKKYSDHGPASCYSFDAYMPHWDPSYLGMATGGYLTSPINSSSLGEEIKGSLGSSDSNQ